MDVINRIDKLKDNLKISDNDIEKYLNIKSFKDLRNKKSPLTSHIIEKLSNLFCCNISYLLNGEINKHKTYITVKNKNLSIEDLKKLEIVNKIALNQFEIDKLL